MQSLDSSCQEADFIINDTLKKLKGSNSGVNANATLRDNTEGLSLSSGSGTLLQPQSSFIYQTQQRPPPYHQLHGLSSNTQTHLTSVIQHPSQLSPLSTVTDSASVSVTFPSKTTLLDSSLLHCNISQIPAQPPICIFDDDESPSETQSSGLDSVGGLDNMVIISEQSNLPSAVGASTQSACSSSSTTLSNFNSITSPSAVVPDLLLSTPPGVNSGFTAHTSSTTNTNPQAQYYQIQHLPQQTQPLQHIINKKAEKRPSSSNNSAIYNIQQSQSTNLLSTTTAISSPVLSPSKRHKSKESSTSSRNTSSPSTLNRISSATLTSPATSLSKRDNASNFATNSNAAVTTTFTSSTSKFFNIHDKIKELYLQLLTNDLNQFAETGLKQRTRSFVLERLVERERLNTIVVNLYPGNKGYSLALPYDERQSVNNSNNEWNITESNNFSAPDNATGVQVSAIQKNNTSRSKLSIDADGSQVNQGAHTKIKAKFTDLHEVDNAEQSSSLSEYEYRLVEVLRWPYENDLLLQCIDREVVPDFLVDILNAVTITLNSALDSSEAPRVHTKPNVFYAGCIIAQIRDYRQTFATSTNICDTKHILLRPTNATIYSDVQHMVATNATTEEKLALESQLVLATAEPLCLDPDPNIGLMAINSQHERRLFNSHELRRQMKKFTQISINRKRKLDQFTHHYGLELCDYLARLRSRPRGNNTNLNITPATAPSNNPLVGAMLTSFTSKVPRRPREVIRPIRPPRVDYPATLKMPENLINVEKQAKAYEKLNEFSENCKDGCHANCRHNFQPQLVEEYILETEREDNEGRRVVYHIKLSIYQRPSDSEYLGELYVDRDYQEGERNGESCRFTLGTRVHANRYIQQFREIFTEEGRKAVKITHIVPGHSPTVTHTGLTQEQRQAILLQQQQQRQPNFATQHQQQQQPQAQHQQHVVVVNNSVQQHQVLPATVHHGVAPTISQSIATQPITSVSKTVKSTESSNGNTIGSAQHTFRHQQGHESSFIDINGTSVQSQQVPNISNPNIGNSSIQIQHQNQQQTVQLQQLGVVSASVPVQSSNNTTHQLNLSNGSLLFVQQQPSGAQHQSHQTVHHQTTNAIQHAGITIQPSTAVQQQPKTIHNPTQLSSAISTNSALRTQLSSNVPILQAQLKAAPIITSTQQHQFMQKQQTQQCTTNNSSASIHPDPAINAIVSSIMNTANQWQQQQKSTTNINTNANVSNINISNTIGPTNNNGPPPPLKNSNNASILSLLNSAPAAMTSTPVASGTFATSTNQQQQQQPVTLVQHQNHQLSSTVAQTVVDPTFVQAQRPNSGAQTLITSRKQQTSDVLQNLLNTNRKINIVGASNPSAIRNTSGNLIAVNLNHQSSQAQQQVSMSALASQLASPPAIMTNSSGYSSYTVSTGSGGGTVKILNTGNPQQRMLASALRRDIGGGSSSCAPPNAVVVGMAVPSPGSDSNASNASGFAIPQVTAGATNSTSLTTLLANSATPSPSGSDHSQTSSNQNQTLLDRLNNVSSTVSAVALPNMSPQQQVQTQFITKSIVHSPATSIQSPLSSPHPQPSASPHQQQHQQTTTTLNLQSINLSTLQGAMANFPGLQNVQVQIPGFTQPISLQFSGNSLQAAVQQPQQSSQQQTGSTTMSMLPTSTNNSSVSVQQTQSPQRSLLVSVPCSAAPGSLGQQQHQQQTSTIVSLPSSIGSSAGTQTVVISNTSTTVANAVNLNNSTNASGTTTMLTLPIAQLVGAGVQKLNPQTVRTSGIGSSLTSTGNVVIQQQQQHQQQPQSGMVSNNSAAGGNNASIQLLGTLQQRPRNIQVVGTKQLSGNRQIITQRHIGGSTVKITGAPINTNTNAISTAANLSNAPIVMSTQKVQLKAIKTPSQQQQPHRILTQATASAASQTTPQVQQQQQLPLHQQIQITGRTTTSTTGNLSQRTLNAIAAAKQQQAAGVNRRRSTTDATK